MSTAPMLTNPADQHVPSPTQPASGPFKHLSHIDLQTRTLAALPPSHHSSRDPRAKSISLAHTHDGPALADIVVSYSENVPIDPNVHPQRKLGAYPLDRDVCDPGRSDPPKHSGTRPQLITAELADLHRLSHELSEIHGSSILPAAVEIRQLSPGESMPDMHSSPFDRSELGKRLYLSSPHSLARQPKPSDGGDGHGDHEGRRKSKKSKKSKEHRHSYNHHDPSDHDHQRLPGHNPGGNGRGDDHDDDDEDMNEAMGDEEWEARTTKKRYKELKRKVLAIQTENDELYKKLTKIKTQVSRLKFERGILFKKLEKVKKAGPVNKPADGETKAEHSDEGEGGRWDSTNEGEARDDDGAEANRGEKQPKKKLKLTDPNAPRRATNAFMFYANLAREELKRERQQKINDGVELDEANLTKALGAKWRSLDNEERKYYQELFRKDVERYQRELDEYLQNQRNEEAEAKRLEKEAKAEGQAALATTPLVHIAASGSLGDALGPDNINPEVGVAIHLQPAQEQPTQQPQ